MRCLLIGNYGVGNLGDEALKEYFLTQFPEVDWVVVSAHPSKQYEVARLPVGLRSLLSFRWIRTITEYRKADAVVFGGGSLFTDVESVFACILWGLHAFCAYAFGKDVHVAFQGVGPFRYGISAWITHVIFQKAVSISVRDEASVHHMKSWKLHTKIVQSFDPVFSLMKNKSMEVRSENILVLIPRSNSSVNLMNMAQKAVQSKEWNAIKILSMQPCDKTEIRFCRHIAKTFSADIVNVTDLDTLLHTLSDCSHVVSERYHGALAGLALGKEIHIVSQSPGDKLASLGNRTDAASLIKKGEEHLRIALSS